MNNSFVARNAKVYLNGYNQPTQQPARLTFITYLSIFIVFILVVITISVVNTRSKSTEIIVRKVDTSRQNKKMRLDVQNQTKKQKNNIILIAPLRWDTDEGAFMINMKVGHGDVQLVFDTGSSQVSVKGPECRWTECDNEDVCVVKDCPLPETYKPAGPALAPGEAGAGTNTTLTYGSQEDTIQHFLDTIGLVAIGDPATLCNVLTSGITRVPPGATQYSIDNVIVHNVSAIKGTSTSNLFGFANVPLNDKHSETNGEFTLIEQVFKDRIINWNLVLWEQHGWWVAGELPVGCFPALTYIPLITPTVFHNFITNFYVLPILSFEVGNNEPNLHEIQDNAVVPKYCVIDTGTTLTYGDPGLGSAMRREGYVDGKGWLRITLGTVSNNYSLTYSPSMLIDPEYPGTSIMQVDSDTTLDDYNEIFNNEKVLLFGILMMTNRVWNFNVANECTGIGLLS